MHSSSWNEELQRVEHLPAARCRRDMTGAPRSVSSSGSCCWLKAPAAGGGRDGRGKAKERPAAAGAEGPLLSTRAAASPGPRAPGSCPRPKLGAGICSGIWPGICICMGIPGPGLTKGELEGMRGSSGSDSRGEKPEEFWEVGWRAGRGACERGARRAKGENPPRPSVAAPSPAAASSSSARPAGAVAAWRGAEVWMGRRTGWGRSAAPSS